MNTYDLVIDELKSYQDENFRAFSERIVNGEKPLIGVKIPKIREIARRTPNAYLDECEFKYFEDTMLYGLIVAKLPYDEFLEKFKFYLTKADSWSHVDTFVPSIKCIPKRKDEFLERIKADIEGSEGFELRFYIIALMTFYLDEENLDYIFAEAERLDGRGFYNDMAIAWLISVAFVKFKERTYEFLSGDDLSKFTHNKAISKICDSFRVAKEDKEKIKKMRKA